MSVPPPNGAALGGAATPAAPAARVAIPPRCARVAVEYSIAGDLRYLSHHDELRMLTRALVRARWPLAHSHGFNPAPRIALPLPRSLGTASDCQLAVVDLCAPGEPAALRERLAGALPADCAVTGVWSLPVKCMPQAVSATYAVEVEPGDMERLGGLVLNFEMSRPRPVLRDDGPGTRPRPVDIQPYIQSIELAGRSLRMELRIAQQRSARPAELLTTLELPAETYSHRLRRVAVQWDSQFAAPNRGPARTERNNVE